MTVSTKTAKMLWGRAAARCSICRTLLFVDATETDDAALVGEMGHMVAESEDGPRGKSPLTRDQRDLYDNLLLLCPTHHSHIDAQEGAYPIERLKEIKRAHETWVRESLPEHDIDKQRDDEVYAGFVDQWARLCELNNWSGWSSLVLGNGQPQMPTELDKKLFELRRWLLVRVWPTRYPRLEQAFQNFARVLGDFHNEFRKHAELPHPTADTLLTKKFYQIPEWNPERYEKLSLRFDFHVDLVQDLMLELTRAANLVCDEIRAFILHSYRLEEGRISVISGPTETLQWRESVVQYSTEERLIRPPYPGLPKFLTTRANRDLHYGEGTETS